MKSFMAIVLCFVFVAIGVRADSISASIENDFVVHTDHNYTHGTRFQWLSDTNMWWGTLLDKVDAFDNRNKTIGMSLGQYMYTPTGKKETRYIPGDRPYCGWLYGELIAQASSERHMDLFALDFGTVGPNSYAEETQTFVHKLTGSTLPMGWHHQIKNEPGLDAVYQHKYLIPVRLGYFDFQVIPHGGGSVGNIHTYADAGCLFRLGHNIPKDFGALRMEPAIRAVQGSFWNKIGYYIFADTEGKYVVRDISLDGNTFRESHSIPKEDWVGEISYGFGLKLDRFNAFYSFNIRSREFEGQKEPQEFGTLALSWEF